MANALGAERLYSSSSGSASQCIEKRFTNHETRENDKIQIKLAMLNPENLYIISDSLIKWHFDRLVKTPPTITSNTTTVKLGDMCIDANVHLIKGVSSLQYMNKQTLAPVNDNPTLMRSSLAQFLRPNTIRGILIGLTYSPPTTTVDFLAAPSLNHESLAGFMPLFGLNRSEILRQYHHGLPDPYFKDIRFGIHANIDVPSLSNRAGVISSFPYTETCWQDDVRDRFEDRCLRISYALSQGLEQLLPQHIPLKREVIMQEHWFPYRY